MSSKCYVNNFEDANYATYLNYDSNPYKDPCEVQLIEKLPTIRDIWVVRDLCSYELLLVMEEYLSEPYYYGD